MEKRCGNCRFLETEPELEPCRSCGRYYLSLAHGTTDNWQSRPKRKELEAQLTTANAELESMHRELADKQAIIDEQAKEIAEHRQHISILMKREDALEKRVRTMTVENYNLKNKRTSISASEPDELNKWYAQAKKIIDERLKERDEARRLAIKLRDEVAKLREWSKKDKAIIADLERELEAAKRTNTYTYKFSGFYLPTTGVYYEPLVVRCALCGQELNKDGSGKQV